MRSAEENKLEKDLRKWFNKLQRKIQKLIDTYYEDELFFLHINKVYTIVEEMKPEYRAILLKHGLTQFYNARETTTTLYTIQQKKVSTKAGLYEPQLIREEDVGLFRTNPQIEDSLRYNTFQASDTTLARVTQNITNNLADSYHEGLGIRDAGRRITKEFAGLKGWESRRIARTEINSAQNEGAFSAYDELGVEYQMWWTGKDNRVRDSHRPLHGHIVAVGNTFSNGLLYPGDKSGPIKEWINCRCTSIPYIIPLGKMAPPGLTEFTEDQLVDIPGFEVPYLDEGETIFNDLKIDNLDNVDRILAEIHQRTDDFDIYRLDKKERDFYLKTRKHYEILKDAIENKNYARLDEIKDLVGEDYFINSKQRFLDDLKEGSSWIKDDLSDLIDDLNYYEKHIKDSNLIIETELEGIDWESSESKDWYNCVDGNYVPFNKDEKFVKIYFQDEKLTIWKSEDLYDELVLGLYEDYKKLPSALKNSREIVLSAQNPRTLNLIGGDNLHLGYVSQGKGNRIIQFSHRNERQIKDTLPELFKKNLIHESTHNLEKDSNFFISNSKEFVEAFKRDQKRLLKEGFDLEHTYPTKYAHDFTEEAIKTGKYNGKDVSKRVYSETFADCMKEYLTIENKNDFKWKETAKVLDKAKDGKFKKNTTVQYKDWLKEEANKYNISKSQKRIVRELELKEDEGIKLTKKERKELDYLHDRQEFSYLHQQKLKEGKYFNQKRYDDLYRKFKKELKLPKDNLFEEFKNEGEIKFTKKEEEEYRKLKSHVDSGEKLKFKKRIKYDEYNDKADFNRLYAKYGHNMPDFHKNPKDYDRYKELIGENFVKEHFGVKTAEEFLQIGKVPKPKPKIRRTKTPQKPKEVIIDEHNGKKFKDYQNVTDEIDEHMANVQKDVKYEVKHIKAIKDYGGDRWYAAINDYCYGNESLEKRLKDQNLTKSKVKRKIKDLDETIEMSPGADDNYVLWKGGDSRGIDLTPGAKNKWDAYSSTSFDRSVGEEYYDGRKEYLEKEGIDAIPLLFKIRAKTGSKGVYIEDRMQATPGEYEFLLGRQQEFKIIDTYPNPDNPKMIICEIELL